MTQANPPRTWPILVALIGATAVILAAIISQPIFQRRWIEPYLCGDRKFEFKTPVNGERVTGSAGVIITGTTCGYRPDEDHGWVFEFDSDDDTYYSVSEQPLDGREWAVFDGPIGDPEDVDKTYTLALLHANAECNATLVGLIAKGGGEASFKKTQKPTGCTEPAAQRTIVVTYAKR